MMRPDRIPWGGEVRAPKRSQLAYTHAAEPVNATRRLIHILNKVCVGTLHLVMGSLPARSGGIFWAVLHHFCRVPVRSSKEVSRPCNRFWSEHPGEGGGELEELPTRARNTRTRAEPVNATRQGRRQSIQAVRGRSSLSSARKDLRRRRRVALRPLRLGLGLGLG